jgi:uncharacterized membrane protein
MEILEITLAVATFLCSLVAGFLFAFAIVMMPGIKNLSDREFIRAFQGIDGIIQNNQPLFMLVWVGSIVALIASAVLSIGKLDGVEGVLVIAAAVVYLLGVQLPTATINVPLNNHLQTLDVDAMDEPAQRAARQAFEPRWNQWNQIRTVVACLVSVLLIVVIIRI